MSFFHCAFIVSFFHQDGSEGQLRNQPTVTEKRRHWKQKKNRFLYFWLEKTLAVGNCFSYMWARKFKKVRAKKLVKSNKSKTFFREIAFLAVLNFFPVQELIFGHFWNCEKWNLVEKIIHEIDNIWFHEFFGLDFFKFSGLLWWAALFQPYIIIFTLDTFFNKSQIF